MARARHTTPLCGSFLASSSRFLCTCISLIPSVDTLLAHSPTLAPLLSPSSSQAHTSGLANPLNDAVQRATTQAAPPEDSLYTEYGGFKFANENPELYTDYDPGTTSAAPADGADAVDEHDNADLYGGTVANDAVADASYLEFPVPEPKPERPQPPAGTPSKINDDDDVIGAFQAAIDDKNAYLTMPAADAAAAADTGVDDPAEPAVYDEAGSGAVAGEEPNAVDDAAPEAAAEAAPEAAAEPAVYDEAGSGAVVGEEPKATEPAAEPAVYDEAGSGGAPGETAAEAAEEDPAEDDGLYDNAGPAAE